MTKFVHWRVLIPSFFTVAALLAGFLSLIEAAKGRYALSAQLIMLSMILDGFDGNLARLLKATSKFGAEFDTFVDITSFGVAPAFLAYQCALSEFKGVGLFLSAAIVLSGAMRLSRFKVVDPHRGQRGFLGLPITVNAGWIAVWVLIAYSGRMGDLVYTIHEGPLAVFVWGCVVVFVFLQMSHLRYPKPTKNMLFFVFCVIMVALLFFKVQIAIGSALAMCAYGLYYAFVSPFLPKGEVPVSVVVDDDDGEDPITVHHS